MIRNSILWVCLVFISSATWAQQPTTLTVETQSNTLVFQTDAQNHLRTIYFGKRLKNKEELALIETQNNQRDVNTGIYNSIYTPSGSWNMLEPALNIVHADGNASTDLIYQSINTLKENEDVTLTTILLKDPVYQTEVKIFLKAYFQEDVIEQWTEIKNTEKAPITLQKYASANLYLNAQKFYLTHYLGAWGREMRPEETALTGGIKVIDSKLGTRTNLYEPPTFMLSFNKPSEEDQGDILLGTLGWSGNFKIDFEVDSYHNLRVIAGINPHASAYPLASNTVFKTPSFIYTLSHQGKGFASRNLHRWARKYRILDGTGERLTLLNNWEATYFDFDQQKITNLFKDGKKLGVDLFLLDDGWFANKYPRNDDTAGLGDWEENRKKLPDGLGYLVKEAQKTGIKFGIWLEPEMVNPRSELYEKHPDWVVKQPQRPEHYFRNQLVLDLSNPQVQDYVFGVVDKLFTKNPGLAFIKWDCNAVTFNAHSAYLQARGESQGKFYVEYIKGLYSVLERIRVKYPKIPMMLCSGGGGRVDYEALKYFTEFWPSDNTEPLERIFIQWNYSHYFPAVATCNHVTDWGKQPLKFRTDVAMMGKLGFDIVVEHLSKDDLVFGQLAIENYNKLKNIIWQGEQYRLVDPYKNDIASLMYVDENQSKAIMFNYLVSNRFELTATPRAIQLKGLNPNKRYKIEEINLYANTPSTLNSSLILSGDFLMTVGYNPEVNDKRTSVILTINEVK
ncbi:alpha-galactosidase [Flectobacillus longus]|uniref:alpha-galactosidase n=1 Tax=Flectobacillus longus TaxID=2984207 RepID=UPI0024B6B3F6|nr:alpha-galactosidase [Flectobacillus longus]MDI9882332.1 alpha-galactosidase [Flectobacillus longus]